MSYPSVTSTVLSISTSTAKPTSELSYIDPNYGDLFSPQPSSGELDGRPIWPQLVDVLSGVAFIVILTFVILRWVRVVRSKVKKRNLETYWKALGKYKGIS